MLDSVWKQMKGLLVLIVIAALDPLNPDHPLTNCKAPLSSVLVEILSEEEVLLGQFRQFSPVRWRRSLDPFGSVTDFEPLTNFYLLNNFAPAFLSYRSTDHRSSINTDTG